MAPAPAPADAPPATTLPPVAALRARLAANPEDPCVVFPDAMGDWRWRSWRWLMTQASGWARALGPLAGGERVAYRWRPTPAAVSADLGIQLAGGVAVPSLDGEEAALPPLWRWLAVDGEPTPEGVEAATIAPPVLGDEDAVSAPVLLAAAAGWDSKAPDTAGGGALVRRGARWETSSAGEQAAAAVALAMPSPSRRRPVALVVGDLAAAPERAWLTWALSADAALVLPGDPAFAAWGLFWPRPTDACLPVEQLGQVRAALATLGGSRAQRRRLARLRRLVVWGGEPEAGERTAWEALGVSLAPFPLAPGLSP